MMPPAQAGCAVLRNIFRTISPFMKFDFVFFRGIFPTQKQGCPPSQCFVPLTVTPLNGRFWNPVSLCRLYTLLSV